MHPIDTTDLFLKCAALLAPRSLDLIMASMNDDKFEDESEVES